jgi:hypothetical protein
MGHVRYMLSLYRLYIGAHAIADKRRCHVCEVREILWL